MDEDLRNITQTNIESFTVFKKFYEAIGDQENAKKIEQKIERLKSKLAEYESVVKK